MTALVRKCIQKMAAYVPGEQPSDPGVIKLNTNENPYPPSPAVMRALGQINGDMLRRYPDPECKALRSAIAKLHGCSPDQVFTGNGGDELLALCSRTFVEDDGTIAYFEPSYSLYPVLARIRDVRSRAVCLDKDFSWPDTPERIASRCSANLFYMTNPNAPTGRLYPKRDVLSFCKKSKGVVVIDEAYVDFAAENCIDLALRLKNTLVLRSLSKSYSLAGLRAGYAVGPKELIAALFKTKDSYNLDRAAQCLALAAIRDQPYMRANARRIIATRARLAGALQSIGFLTLPSETNFIWAKPAKISAKALFLGLRRRNILVRYFDGSRTRDYLRISVGTEEQIDMLLKAIAEIQSRLAKGSPSKNGNFF